MDYRDVVAECLKRNEYPSLTNHVVISIYYKMLKPSTEGELVGDFDSVRNAYEQAHEPFKYVFLTHGQPYRVYVHKESDVDVQNLPVKCINVKLCRGYLDGVLDKKHRTFEEEIYEMIRNLNFDPPAVREALGLTFVDSTRFLPCDAKLRVTRFQMKRFADTGCSSANLKYFGVPSKRPTLFQTRFLDGRISEAKNTGSILSLNDAIAWKMDKACGIPTWVHEWEPYCIHMVKDKNALIPLAFNPFENPIVV